MPARRPTPGADLSVQVVPVAGQVKGVDGDDWVLACVLVQVTAVITTTARIAYGHCERMQWQGLPGQDTAGRDAAGQDAAGRWMIAPGTAPAPAPATWPGTDTAAEAGWRTWVTTDPGSDPGADSGTDLSAGSGAGTSIGLPAAPSGGVGG